MRRPRALTVAEHAAAQTADVAGTWTFRVTTDQSVTTPTVTLEQNGETLTGHYSSETLGEQEVEGTVSAPVSPGRYLTNRMRAPTTRPPYGAP